MNKLFNLRYTVVTMALFSVLLSAASAKTQQTASTPGAEAGYFIGEVHMDTVTTYTLDITTIGEGSVEKNPDQASYSSGSSVQLTATPSDPSWSFSHWECDTSGSTNPGTITMNANKTITAVFTRVFGQFVTQGGKLVGTAAVGNASQGTSVALSYDGSTAIVGGTGDNGNTGAAWIYTRCAEIWSQEGAKLVGTGAVGAASQGQSVSISTDGNTAIVGGYGDNADAGAVWIFTRSGDTWSQQGSKLVGTGSSGPARQGYSVALSADGNTAIVGGYLDNINQGAAWIFTRSGGVWSQQGSKLVGTGVINFASQGRSVALSADGNTAVVGGYTDRGYLGAVWIFTRSAGVWTQQGSKLVGSDATGNARIGQSVSISDDGNTVIAGGYADDTNNGAAWVFTRSGGVWSQQGAKLVGFGAAGPAQQGFSVSLSADGNKAIVGGYADDGGKGAIWVYTRSGGLWSQQGSKLVGAGAVDPARQGIAVGLAGDGNTAFVGGDADNSNTGAVWPFALGIQTFSITSAAGPNGSISPLGITGVDFGDSVVYSFTPDIGYFVSDVHVDSVSIGSVSSYTFTNVTADHTIEAYFAQSQYTLDVTISGSGAVARVPDQLTYIHGTSVGLTATPSDTTWLFTRWEGDASGSDNPLNIVMEGNRNITAVFSRIPELAAMYRSFLPDSLALDRDNRGKLGRYVKRKPTGADFQVYVINPYGSADQLNVIFGSTIDVSVPLVSDPPSTVAVVGYGDRKWSFSFSSLLAHGDTVRITGFSKKGKPQKVSKFWWSRNGAKGGPDGGTAVFERNVVRLPMPNRVNGLYEGFAQQGFGAGDGLLIGEARPDSSRYYGWLLAKKYRHVLRTLNYRGQLHAGVPKGLDTYLNGRLIKRRLRQITPNKHDNRLLANLVALKVNIVMSSMEKTLLGFGELIYDDGSANPLNGLMVKEISEVGDSLMMGSYEDGAREFASPGVFANLDSTVFKINSSFEGPIDTISFADELVYAGTRELGELSYLKPNPSAIPTVITPVGSPSEELPDQYVLHQNFPNPFNPSTTIAFDLPEISVVNVSVYNLLGQRVALLSDDGEFDSGEHEVEFDAYRLASGVYLYRIEARSLEEGGRSFTATRKMMVLK